VIGKASYGLGSAIGVAARSKKVALIGDYALLHSGIPSLIDVFEKGIPVLVVVLVNRVMGMTGGQQVPDPVPFVAWADPIICGSGDLELLRNAISVPECPKIVIVEGTCPEGRMHERVEC
jgi:indolepyruvate ferredoxin oxidoreductase alpha subunit